MLSDPGNANVSAVLGDVPNKTKREELKVTCILEWCNTAAMAFDKRSAGKDTLISNSKTRDY